MSTSFSSFMLPSILWRARSLLLQSIPTTWCFHSRASLVGFGLQLASPTLFPPNITMVIMTKQFTFCFIRQEDISTEIRLLSPCAVGNCSLALFKGAFDAIASFLLSDLWGHADIQLVLLWIYTFVPVSSSIFRRFFVVGLGPFTLFVH